MSLPETIAAHLSVSPALVWAAGGGEYPECMRAVVPDYDPALAGGLVDIAIAHGFERVCINVCEERGLPAVLADADPFTAAFDVCVATVRS